MNIGSCLCPRPAAQGYGELAWDATRELLLTWATGGFYQAIQGYHFYSALYAGYDEKGWLGALSVLNPLAGILTPAENATHEAVKGDYRAAGREGIKALVAAVITVVTIAIVPKPPGGKPPPGLNGGAPPDVRVPSAKFPETAAHIRDAQAAGRASTLTIDRGGATPRRADALNGIEKVAGKQLDEYPPAMFREGGKGASVRPVSPSDNMGAGACIENQCRGLPDGTKVRIVVE